jgi:Tfp pilus assembly protein PilX
VKVFSVRRRPGIALISIMILLTLIAAIVGSSTLYLQERVSVSGSRDRQLKGRYAAQAGLNRALVQLRENGDWSPGTFTETLGSPHLGFEVRVVNNRANTVPVTAPDDTELAPGHVWLESTGIVDGERVRGRFGQATTRAVQPLPVFDHAIHFRGGPPDLGAWRQCTIDSYDGIVANYTPFRSPGRPDRVRAHVRIDNGGAGVDVNLDGNLIVPSPDVNLTIAGGAWSGALIVDETTYTPLHFRAPEALEDATITTPPASGLIPPGRYGSLPFSNDDIELQEGDYYFRDFDAQTRDNLTLLGPGPTTIYIERGFNPAKNTNVGGQADQLRVFFIDTGATCQFQQEFGSVFVGVLAGSTLRLSMTPDSHVYGAVICGEYLGTMPNSFIHYDESLGARPLQAATEWVLVNEGSE